MLLSLRVINTVYPPTAKSLVSKRLATSRLTFFSKSSWFVAPMSEPPCPASIQTDLGTAGGGVGLAANACGTNSVKRSSVRRILTLTKIV